MLLLYSVFIFVELSTVSKSKAPPSAQSSSVSRSRVMCGCLSVPGVLCPSDWTRVLDLVDTRVSIRMGGQAVAVSASEHKMG